jgi:hypothetical protein
MIIYARLHQTHEYGKPTLIPTDIEPSNLCNILIKQFYLKKEAWLSFSDNQIIDLQDIINIDKQTKKRPSYRI